MTHQLYDGATFEYRGHTFRVNFPNDDSMQEPWKEHDGHGIISDSTTRAKDPGERVLYSDRGWHLYYDVQETLMIAKRDGWGCSHKANHHATKGEAIACAVDQDFDRMQAWCENAWAWIGVVVTLLDDDDGNATHETEALWGIESDAGEDLTEVAHELADEILSRVEVDEPLAVLSEN